MLACGVAVVVLTEALSLFTAISARNIAGLWCLLGCGALVMVVRWCRRPHVSIAGPALSGAERLMLATIVLIGAVTFITALLTPPSHVDSMVYRLPRMLYWAQHGSVEHYRTNVIAQLFMSPWVEFCFLHLYLLSGGDWYVGLVQWVCMAGSLVGVAQIAAYLGAPRKVQIFAALICATIPMGILQAHTTQVEYAVGFWLSVYVVFFLAWRQRATWPDALAAGAALGLAMLSKPTGYFFGFSFVLWTACAGLAQRRTKVLAQLVAMAAIALLINSGHFARNLQLFGDPLGARQLPSNRNTLFGVRALVSVMARNAAQQFVLPVAGWNRLLTSAVRAGHALAGVDADDRGTTVGGYRFGVGYRLHEDGVASPLHALLGAGTLLALGAVRRLRRQRTLVLYGLACLGASAVYCVFMKWEPYNARYHLPLLVLWSPLIAVTAATLLSRAMNNLLAILFVAQAIPALVVEPAHLWLGKRNVFAVARIDAGFRTSPWNRLACMEITEALRYAPIAWLGMLMSEVDCEYPFLRAVQARMPRPVRFVQVNVRNASRTIPSAMATPEYVMAWSGGAAPCRTIDGTTYVLAYAVGAKAVYERAGLGDVLSNALARAAVVQNGDFARGLAGWTIGPSGSTALVLGATAARDYVTAVQLTPGMTAEQAVAVRSGVVYKLSAAVRAPASGGHGMADYFGEHVLRWLDGATGTTFGALVSVQLPDGQRQMLHWPQTYGQWWRRELVFTNVLTGRADVMLSLPAQSRAPAGEFTQVQLRREPCGGAE